MYFYALIFISSSTLLAGDFEFKPLPNWLFITIIAFLIGVKIFIGKFVKNRKNNSADMHDYTSQQEKNKNKTHE